MTTFPNDLDTRFRALAQDFGLLDAAYDTIDSPFGPMLLATSREGLLAIRFHPDADEYAEQLSRIAGVRVLRAPRAIDEARRELDEYFAGKRRAFDLSVDLRALTPFTVQVLRELAQVPFGRTATYRELAERVGKPNASRAVGTVMNRNRIPIVLPCHRVIGSSGNLVGYAGGLEMKEKLLRLEGAIL